MLAKLHLILGFTVYFGVNLYLWWLPITHETLFAATTPLGLAFYAWFMWYVSRDRDQ